MDLWLLGKLTDKNYLKVLQHKYSTLFTAFRGACIFEKYAESEAIYTFHNLANLQKMKFGTT